MYCRLLTESPISGAFVLECGCFSFTLSALVVTKCVSVPIIQIVAWGWGKWFTVGKQEPIAEACQGLSFRVSILCFRACRSATCIARRASAMKHRGPLAALIVLCLPLTFFVGLRYEGQQVQADDLLPYRAPPHASAAATGPPTASPAAAAPGGAAMRRTEPATAPPSRGTVHSMPLTSPIAPREHPPHATSGSPRPHDAPAAPNGTHADSEPRARPETEPHARPSAPQAAPGPPGSKAPRAVTLLMTHMQAFSNRWLHPREFPCPLVKCVVHKANKTDFQAQLRRADILQYDSTLLRSGGAFEYDLRGNPQRLFLMMVNVENLRRHLEFYRTLNWWVGWLWKDPTLWEHFHIVSSTEPGSIAPYNYWVDWMEAEAVRPYVAQYQKRARRLKHAAPLVLFMSSHQGRPFTLFNATTDRAKLAKAMLKAVSMMVVGQVRQLMGMAPNAKKDFGDCPQIRHLPYSTLCMLSQYLFFFVVENSVDWGYVSEKVYYSLAVGTVPVYLGAPDIDNYVPPRSIIKVTDFPSLQALGGYLKCLVNMRPDLYDYYLNWKSRTNEAWAAWSSMASHPFCRACSLVARNDSVLYDRKARVPRVLKHVFPSAEGSQRPFPECMP